MFNVSEIQDSLRNNNTRQLQLLIIMMTTVLRCMIISQLRGIC